MGRSEDGSVARSPLQSHDPEIAQVPALVDGGAEVGMRIDQARQNGSVRQVDDRRVGGRGYAGADRGDPPVLNDDGLFRGRRAAGRIDELARMDHQGCCPRGQGGKNDRLQQAYGPRQSDRPTRSWASATSRLRCSWPRKLSAYSL